MKEWGEGAVLVVEKAKGSYLYDTDGRKYLDGVSSLWCNVHGHRVPEIDRAVKKQLGKVAHSTFLGLSNVPAVELARELARITPKGLTRVFYSDSGSEANEIALKMAFQYWQLKGKKTKQKFARLVNAYHGDTVGAVSVGGIQIFHDIFKPLLFETFSIKAPHRYRERFVGSEEAYAEHAAARVEEVLRENHHRIAALIVEPLVQGAAGMLTHPKGYLRRLRELTRRYGVLLIVDEVATGFGRTGKMFACEHEGVSPDILCVAKGLTGGYLPLSATLATQEIYGAFLGRYDEFKVFFHGHTYTGNPLGCAAALASLKLFKKNRTLDRVRRLAKLLSRELRPMAAWKEIGDIRQVGLMTGIELVKNKETAEPYPIELKAGARVAERARRYGVIIRPLGNVVVLMPPFCFTDKELKHLVAATGRAIREVMSEAPFKTKTP